jgi:hypothetical protein
VTRRNAYRIMVEKLLGKRTLERPGKWEDKISMHRKGDRF